MKKEILTLLRSGSDYISGQELCNHFGVSRTAVWKVMNQLKEEGYQIEAVQNKGYKLISSPDVMNECELASRMKTAWAGREVHYFDVTGSTNTDAKRFAEEGSPHGTLVVADMQESGRGRRGRTWQSPTGTTISMSLVCKPEFEPTRASMLTLVMGLAVSKAIEEVTALKAGIKWPNDIVVDGKKVCGILTEMSAERDYIQYLVIGIGINANNGLQGDLFPEEIRDMATSLYLQTGHQVSRAALIERSMFHFEGLYEKFLQTLDLSLMQEDYEVHLVNKDAQVKVLDPKGDFEGIARGIDPDGDLLVEREDGRLEKIYAGEVSVRGLYGYV